MRTEAKTKAVLSRLEAALAKSAPDVLESLNRDASTAQITKLKSEPR